MNALETYRIKLYGTGFELYYLDLPSSEREKLLEYNDAHQLNYIHYKCFGVNNPKDSWLNRFLKRKIYSLEVMPLSSIEVRCGPKKLLKVKASEILKTFSLFPLYNSYPIDIKKPFSESLLVYAVESSGLIREYMFRSNHFNMDMFSIGRFQEDKLSESDYLGEPRIEGIELEQVKSDSLVRKQRLIYW